MDCKIIYTRTHPLNKSVTGIPPHRTKHSRAHEAGLTLIEMMVSLTLGIMILATVGMVELYSNQSFASLYNYATLDNQSHLALDKMSQQIRGGGPMISFSNTCLTFTNFNGSGTISYLYDSNAQTLSCISSGQTNILLQNCKSLAFGMYQRTPVQGSFTMVTATNIADCKLLRVQWSCAKSLWQGQTNESETMNSASIILRNTGP